MSVRADGRGEAFDGEIERVVFTREQIAAAVDELAARIARDYARQPLLLVGVLKGALFVTADLVRALARRRAAGPAARRTDGSPPAARLGLPEVRVDFLATSSYGNAQRSSGEVRLLKDASERIEGRHVLIVEDIVDNGLTLAYLQQLLRGRRPASLRSCVLLDKPYNRSVDVVVDYSGLQAPDAFIVGYGLDYQEKYRNLPYLATLHRWVFER